MQYRNHFCSWLQDTSEVHHLSILAQEVIQSLGSNTCSNSPCITDIQWSQLFTSKVSILGQSCQLTTTVFRSLTKCLLEAFLFLFRSLSL